MFLKFTHNVTTISLKMLSSFTGKIPALQLACADAEEPPLHYRSLCLTANFLARVASNRTLPIYRDLFNNARNSPSTYQLTRNKFDVEVGHPTNFHILHLITTHVPQWYLLAVQVILELATLPKQTTSSNAYTIQLNEIREQHSDYTHCYIDGSKIGKCIEYVYSINS